MRRYRTHRPHRSCGRFRQAKAAESLIAELIGRNSAAYSANSCASVGASFTSGTGFSGECARTCDPCRSRAVRAHWQPGTNPRLRLIILFSRAWKSAAISRQSCLQRGPASQNISRKFGRSLASCLRNRDPSVTSPSDFYAPPSLLRFAIAPYALACVRASCRRRTQRGASYRNRTGRLGKWRKNWRKNWREYFSRRLDDPRARI